MGKCRGNNWHLSNSYRFEGFYPADEKLPGIFGKPQARVLALKRRTKKRFAVSAVPSILDGMTVNPS